MGFGIFVAINTTVIVVFRRHKLESREGGMKLKSILATLVLFFAFSTAFSQSQNSGTSAASFLKIGVGAKAAGLAC